MVAALRRRKGHRDAGERAQHLFRRRARVGRRRRPRRRYVSEFYPTSFTAKQFPQSRSDNPTRFDYGYCADDQVLGWLTVNKWNTCAFEINTKRIRFIALDRRVSL